MRAILVAAFLAGCEREAPSEPRYPRITRAIVARVDLDQDGRVSKDEYAQLAFADEPMDPWDADHDEALDPREIETAFLRADPTRLQVEGRRAVYEKYGWPFGEPTLREGPAATERDDADLPDRERKKSRRKRGPR
jgi:hypothetical protein